MDPKHRRPFCKIMLLKFHNYGGGGDDGGDDDDDDDDDNNNNNSNNITGATGAVSKSPRQYPSNTPGKHEIKELQITVILGAAHIQRTVLM